MIEDVLFIVRAKSSNVFFMFWGFVYVNPIIDRKPTYAFPKIMRSLLIHVNSKQHFAIVFANTYISIRKHLCLITLMA